jgi:pentose-5-phosphate-3-epimerase
LTIFTNLDVILVMSVPAGFRQVDSASLDKINELNEIRARDNTPYRIQDDGGITRSIYNVQDWSRWGLIGRRF